MITKVNFVLNKSDFYVIILMSRCIEIAVVLILKLVLLLPSVTVWSVIFVLLCFYDSEPICIISLINCWIVV